MRRLTKEESLELYRQLDALAPVTLVIPAAVVFNLIGQCQLALRHPSNHGPSALAARQWIEQVARYLDGLVPGTFDLVQMGFDGRFDQPAPASQEEGEADA